MTGVAKLHLQGSDVINIEGYSWYDNYRRNIHENTRTGSGGVIFLIKKEL